MINERKFPRFFDEWFRVNGDLFTPRMFLGQPEGFEFVVAAQWLYVPDFVEYRGGIFTVQRPIGLTDRAKGILDDWFAHYGGEVAPVERIGNLLELWDLFDESDVEEFHDEIMQIAYSMRDSWLALLKLRFPGRDFEVYVSDDHETGPGISFCTAARSRM